MTAAWVLGEVLARGRVRRAFLGVAVHTRPLPARFAEGPVTRRTCVEVAGVTQDGPAAAAKIALGDMLLELDGKPLASSAALHRVLRQVSPGARVQLRVLRDTRLLTIELVTREAVAAA